MAKLCYVNYTSFGTYSWTCPAGVTKVFLIGCGGGAGGSGGTRTASFISYGGTGCTPYLVEVSVVPNTTYSITIGGRGSFGPAQTGTTQNGGDGGDTTFGNLYTFNGASQIIDGTKNTTGWVPATGVIPGWSGNLGWFRSANCSGYINTVSFGSTSGSFRPGTAGGGGFSNGLGGGAPGNANSSGTGTAGATGSGYGAGGGGGGAGSSAGGNGGAGGFGFLQISWIE